MPRGPRHLGEPCERSLQMMEAVMDEDEVEGTVPKREALDVRDDGRDVQPVAPCAFSRPSGSAKG